MDTYFDQMPCLYFSLRDDGTLAAANDTFCTKLGYTKAELSGQKADFIFTIATRIFQQTHFFPLLKMQGYAEEIYITLQAKDGAHLPVLINAERKSSVSGAVTVYAGIIVHNRKKFEDELVAAKKAAEKALHENTALQQATKELQEYTEQLDRQMERVTKQNEELRQFNRVVTHDLQEPLRKLAIFSDIMQGSTAETSAKTIEKIRAVLRQMQAVVSGLQQYVWLTEASVNATPVSLDALLPVVQQQLEAEMPGINLTITKDALPAIEADYEQMKFLLHQLLANAMRFRKPGRDVQVHIAADRLQLNKFRQVAGKYKYTSFLKLQIKDNGTGFDPDYKEQVFELFRRLHPESGPGIGLSLCKKIVANHQGTILINSEKDKGTTVTITLPLHQADMAQEDTANKTHLKTGTE